FYMDEFMYTPYIGCYEECYREPDPVTSFPHTNLISLNMYHAIICCYIFNFISDFINLDALSLPLRKFHGVLRRSFDLVDLSIGCNLSSSAFCKVGFADRLGFHGVPDFLDILFYDPFGFGVFLD
ncbi:hypothetical protein STEG23_033618, partial [Scotinomys teguina]